MKKGLSYYDDEVNKKDKKGGSEENVLFNSYVKQNHVFNVLMISIVVILVIFSIVFLVVIKQSLLGNSNKSAVSSKNSISVTGSSSMSVVSDKASFTVSFDDIDLNYSKSVSKVNKIVTKAISRLRILNSSIYSQGYVLSIETIDYSIRPKYAFYPVYKYGEINDNSVPGYNPYGLDVKSEDSNEYNYIPDPYDNHRFIGYETRESIRVNIFARINKSNSNLSFSSFDAHSFGVAIGKCVDSVLTLNNSLNSSFNKNLNKNGSGVRLNLGSLSFGISDYKMNEVKLYLLSEAVQSAKKRAEVIASSLGTNLKGVMDVNFNDFQYYPVYYKNLDYESYSKDRNSFNIEPQSQKISVRVDAVFKI